MNSVIVGCLAPVLETEGPEQNLTTLTSSLNWNVEYPWTKATMADEGANELRPPTQSELETPVLCGTNKIYLGGGWDPKEWGPIGVPIRYLEVGRPGHLTSFGELLRAMSQAFQRPATPKEVEHLRQRYFSQEEFQRRFPNEQVTFGNWLAPHTYFEGPMRKEQDPTSQFVGLYVYGYGS